MGTQVQGYDILKVKCSKSHHTAYHMNHLIKIIIYIFQSLVDHLKSIGCRDNHNLFLRPNTEPSIMFDIRDPVGETYFGSNYIERVTERLTAAKYKLNQKVF